MRLDAIILAGGKGTRLGHRTTQSQKCALPVNGEPFILSLLRKLDLQIVNHVFICCGFQADHLRQAIEGENFSNFTFVEDADTSVGAGGAILGTVQRTTADKVAIINGDTYLDFDVQKCLKVALNTRSGLAFCGTPGVASASGSVWHDGKFSYRHFDEIDWDQILGRVFTGLSVLNATLLRKMSAKRCGYDDLIEYARSNKDLREQLDCGEFWDIGTPEGFQLTEKLLEGKSNV